MAALSKIIAAVLGVLGVVSASTGADTSKIVEIVQKLAAALGVIQNLSNPTDVATAVADLTAILGEVKQLFPNAGAGVDAAIAAAEKFTATVHNYTSGQVALVDSNFSFMGVAGDLIAVSKGGPAAQTLGL